MATPSDAAAAANGTDMDDNQRAGFLLLALIPADGQRCEDVRCGSKYRLELVEKRNKAILKASDGCAPWLRLMQMQCQKALPNPHLDCAHPHMLSCLA